MSNYYKAEDVQRILCGWCGICENPTMEDLEKCDDICPQFAQIPDADVRPVVRGEWEWEMYQYTPHCSVCGGPGFPGPANGKKYNFCPNCGADMRGGVEYGETRV